MRDYILKKGPWFVLVLSLLISATWQSAPAQSQFDSIKFEDIKSASLSSNRISGSALTPNTIILFRTNEGRYGKMQIKVSDYNLSLTWVTFNPDGNLHTWGDTLTVRGTYTCDLDAGKESRVSVDFWWQIASADERYLTPQNGAVYAVYSPPTTAADRQLAAGQKTITVDTSNRVDSAKQTEKSSKVELKENLSSLLKKKEQLQLGQMAPSAGEPPASFQGVTYEFKGNVQIIRGEQSSRFLNNLKVAEEVTKAKTLAITPATKISQGALIEPKHLPTLEKVEKGMIIYDETSKLAARITGKTNLNKTDYLVLDRPQIHEVLNEFEIPRQTVRLTSGNITPLTPPAVKFQYRQDRKGALTLRSGELWNIKDPWLKIHFKNVPLVGYTAEGISVSVTLDGRIGLTPIAVDGRYSGFNGYEFKLRSGEEISLKVTVAMDIKKDLKIPLFAFDIPAVIATVRGGFYLLVGVDGSFTLVAEATQWLEATAGVSGGTFLWMPTGFRPSLSFNKGFDCDASFAGQIKGYVKGGLLLEIELLGWSLVGAGCLAGMGVDCKTVGSGSLLDVDVYGSLEIYATLCGYRVNFVNNTYQLLNYQKPNTEGYDISYYEVCAWRGSIWGKIQVDKHGKFEPVRATPLKFEVKRNNQVVATVVSQSDNDGNFRVDVKNAKFALYKGDQIRITEVGGNTINSASVSPTLPFEKVRIEYADFFNDVAIGQVSPARVKKWETGDWNTAEWEDIYYTGNILFNNNQEVSCDSEGNFRLSYDFKPGQDVVASIEFNGFKVNSPSVKTDVAFLAKRLVEPGVPTLYTDSDGRLVEKKVDREYFRVFNTRGEKQLSISANYQANYYHYLTLSRIHEYFSGKPIVPPHLLETKIYNFRLSPADSGTSEIVQDFTEEWGWLGDSSGVTSTSQSLGVQKATGLEPQVRPQIKMAKKAQLITGSAPFFRYNSDKTRAQGNPMDEGVLTIFRDGMFIITYEGAEIEMKDQSEKQARGQGHEPPRAGANPLQQELIDRIDSRINPVVLSSIDPISPRVAAPINKIRVQQRAIR